MLPSCISPRSRQLMVVIAANLSLLGAGISLGWSSPILVKLSNINTTTLSRTVTADEGTWMASVVILTGLLGNILGTVFVDWLGRKQMLIIASFPKIANCMFLLFAKEIWQVILARAIDGLLVTMFMVIVSTYTAEIADKTLRGSLGSLFQMFSSMGIVIIMCLGPYISYIAMHIVYFFITVVTLLFIWFLPETPYFLYANGRIDESTRILHFIRKSDAEVCEELKMFAESKTFERKNLWGLWKKRNFLKAIGMVFFLGAASQLTGFNCVSMYLQTMMGSTHTVQPEMASLIFGLVQLISCSIPTLFSDKVGRKPILIVTLFIVALGMAGVGAFFWCVENGVAVNTFLKYVPILAVIMINFGYTAGVGSILFVIMPELFDGPERAIGVSVGLSALCIAAFTLTKYFYVVLNCIGAAASYWTFCAWSLLFILFIIFFVPETKGKAFNEIQEELSGKEGLKRKICVGEKS